MSETRTLVDKIVIACQEKKAKDIVIIDMHDLPGAICQYFVVCEGNSPSQVSAIVDEIENYARIHCNERPIAMDGQREARWVGIDFGTVIVHVFLPELREFYAIEQLWEDCPTERIPNLD